VAEIKPLQGHGLEGRREQAQEARHGSQ
jgi:hypothetical protein